MKNPKAFLHAAFALAALAGCGSPLLSPSQFALNRHTDPITDEEISTAKATVTGDTGAFKAQIAITCAKQDNASTYSITAAFFDGAGKSAPLLISTGFLGPAAVYALRLGSDPAEESVAVGSALPYANQIALDFAGQNTALSQARKAEFPSISTLAIRPRLENGTPTFVIDLSNPAARTVATECANVFGAAKKSLPAQPSRTDDARNASASPPGSSGEYDHCLANADAKNGGVNAYTLDAASCADQEYERTAKELDGVYNRLLSRLSAEKKDALTSEERRWVESMNAKCSQAGKENEGGSLEKLQISECFMTETQSRLSLLKNNQSELP